MNKFSFWQGRFLTETKRAATFVSSFVLLVPFLTGREERWVITWLRETIRSQSKAFRTNKSACLGTWPTAVESLFFLKINAFAQHCCNSFSMHAALWHELSPFFKCCQLPLWSQQPVYPTWLQGSRNPKSWGYGP